MELQKIAEAIKNASYFSGVIQIKENDKIKLHVAKGYAKREDQLLNDLDTRFGIASGTKGFTALAILTLIDQGKLSLEEDVFSLLKYRFDNMKDIVTVKHLLTHTSGIYDYFDEEVIEDFGQLFDKVPIHKIKGPKDMMPLLVEGEAYFKPGEKFKYCNSSFVILALVIEEVSGLSYSDYIDTFICKPLGLNHTGCYWTNQLPENTALGYIQEEDGGWRSNIFDIPMVCTGDGGIYTNAEDVVKLWNGIIKGNILSEKMKAMAFTVYADIGWWKNLHYGLGFYIQHNEQDELKNYFLIGEDPGVSFATNYYVNENRIVTLMGNTSECVWKLMDEIQEFLD